MLTLKIFRWSTGSYLECQDFWRISGIERDVFIYAQPKAALKDFRVTSTLDDSYRNGIFELDVDVRNHQDKATNLTLVYELLNKQGEVVAKEEKSAQVATNEVHTFTFTKNWPTSRPGPQNSPTCTSC